MTAASAGTNWRASRTLSAASSTSTGRHAVSPPGIEPHREGGGDQGVIILFGFRGTEGTACELLDDDRNASGTLGMADLEASYAAQNAA
jgi:hypothetical protein